MKIVDSFPSKPLTVGDIAALDAHERVDRCNPLFGRQPDAPDTIVGISLGLGATVYIFVYDSEWHMFESLQTEDHAAFDSVTDRAIEWAFEQYDRDDIVVLSSHRSQRDAILDLFPNEPVGKDVVTLEAQHGIEHVHPLFCYRQTHEIVVVMLTVTEPLNPLKARFYILGYEPATTAWTTIATEELNDGTELESWMDEDRFEMIHGWITDHHPEDEIAVISPDPM